MSPSKRRDLRYAIRVPAQVRQGAKVRSFLTEDVSYRGCFLRTDTPLPLRALVEVKLVLPPGDTAIHTHGMIVHHVEALNPADRTPGMGVQFFALDRGTREAWESFVRHVEDHYPLAADQSPLTLPDGTPERIRRRFTRHTAVLRVDVQDVDQLRDLVSRDVASGGMFIATDQPLSVGQEVMISVWHPERSDAMLLDAVVRHRSRHPRRGVGVEFLKMDDARREELMEFVRGGIVVDEEPLILDPGDPRVG